MLPTKMNKKISNVIFCFLIVITFFINIVLADNAKDYTLFSSRSLASQNIYQYGTIKENFFTGAVIYNIPLEVMPGTNGLQPKLSLNYNSHLVLNDPNLFGSGWDLNSFYNYWTAPVHGPKQVIIVNSS